MSRFVQENYAAAWESMRPVPRMTIDFGEGRRLERTMRGNVATWLCAPDGRVIDVVPGLCEPKAFLERLTAAVELARVYTVDRSQFEARYQLLHRAATLVPSVALGVDAVKLELEPVATTIGGEERGLDLDLGKSLVESPRTDGTPRAESSPRAPRMDLSKIAIEAPVRVDRVARQTLSSDGGLLALDSAANRLRRDPLARALLLERAWTPRELERRLFRDVLHVDLDDPWLGLADGPFGGGAYEGLDRVRD